VALVVIVMLRIALQRSPRLLARISSRLTQLAVAAEQFGWQAKFKSCLNFYQVWAVRQSVYGFSMPEDFTSWATGLDVLSFDLGGFMFPSWSCAGGLITRLVFTGLWPLFLIAAVAMVLVAREVLRQGSLQRALMRGLEVVVFISFIVLPSVTRSLFLAFQCEEFGFNDLVVPPESKSYLSASPNVECYRSPEHAPILTTAWIFIVLWPIGMPVFYGLILHRCRAPIQNRQPSALSRAIRFLWAEYDTKYFWYELVVLCQKLVLTNFLLFVNFDRGGENKLLRVAIGLTIALLVLTLQLELQPFRKKSDDAIMAVVQLMLVLFFVLGFLLKLCVTEGPNAIHSLMASQVKDSCSTLVGMESSLASAVLVLCASFLVLLVPLVMFMRQMFVAHTVPILRVAGTMELPALVLGPGERYHLFLSHIWSTGQDQCANIKRQLQLLLPGIIVFLDVDDLQDIGDLESYVSATGVMLFFLSKRYFQSGNCLREIRASLEQEKPLVLVHEQQEDKGGAALEVLKEECRDDEMRAKIFDGRTAIVWHRISQYQNLTLKLIATEMLRHAPHEGSSSSFSGAINLVLPGELNVSELALTKPVFLWCSAGNLGAAGFAEELKTSLGGGGGNVRVVDSKPDTTALKFFILYLNKDTWVKQGELLERDVRATGSFDPHHHGAGHGLAAALHLPHLGHAAHDSPGETPIKIILVHENDQAKGACDFGVFFGTTPQSFINEGIYKEIAIALHTPPHRAVSLALVAQALGATKASLTESSRSTRTLADKSSKARAQVQVATASTDV
jgi:hypothetical protein